MNCPFTHEAGAYVVGALSPAERLEFERHHVGCDECARAVRELAGLPGLLGRIDPSVLEPPPDHAPVPDTLLPGLTRAVRARRRTYVAAGVAVAAVVAVLASLVGWWAADDGPAPTPGSGPPGVVARAMEPVGEVPVEATLTLEPVAWGTRLDLTCTYEPGAGEDDMPETVDYVLFVRARDGGTEQVGSWRSAAGKEMRLSAATAEVLDDIAAVEVRTLDGRVVLRLRA